MARLRGQSDTLVTLRDFLRRLYDERQIVFLIVEHNMEFIMSLASHIVVMHQGGAGAGRASEVQASPQVIEAYLG